MSDITEQGPAYSLLDAKVLITSDGSTITPVDLFYARQVQLDPQIQTLTFEGDDTSQQIDLLNRVEVTVTADKLDLDADQAIFGKTRVEDPATGEDWGMYYGDQSEIAGTTAGLQFDIGFKDESADPPVAATLRYTFFKGVLKVKRPQPATFNEKHVSVLNFSFERTTVDIVGDALSGVPTGGAYYRLARLT